MLTKNQAVHLIVISENNFFRGANNFDQKNE